MLCLLIAIALIAIIYLIQRRALKYWLKYAVVQRKPKFLFVDAWPVFIRKQSNADWIESAYTFAPNQRYCGIYQFFIPVLILRDPDLIKQIGIKDFDHFVDHRTFIPEESNPLFGRNLFSLKGQRWRNMRATLSPTFTSSKMKYMFSLISQNGEQFAKHFLKQNEQMITLEMKSTFTRFTNDVIANTAFGVECDSLSEPNNEFYLMGKEITTFTNVWRNLKFAANLICPGLCKIFKLGIFSEEAAEFFTRLIRENIESREKQEIVRPDMINLMMEARKNSLKHIQNSESDGEETSDTKPISRPEITFEDIAGQAVVFFLGGFDSVSALMCFMSYELGINPDIQTKLTEEIDETMKKCNGKITYDSLLNMKYLDMVVSETLRKWPVTPATERVCTKSYTIEPTTPNEKPIFLNEGDLVMIPTMGIHRDPQYYPDPERFDPERFNDENKTKLVPYTYLPFGIGPRSCIGSRFALLETKLLFFHLLSHFEIVPVEKTKVPLQISTKSITMTCEGGFWFGLKRRDK